MIKLDNSKCLFEKDGKEFFYLADTAWMLLTYLSKEEIEYYIKERSHQGFTAIQFVLLPEFDGLRRKNYYGMLPLKSYDKDIVTNEEYYEFARWCVKKANEYGLSVGLFPTWGDKFNKRSGVGPEIFTIENTFEYSKFVSDFFGDLDVIFYLGGDKNPETENHYKIIEKFAEGLRAGKGKDKLISYHPKGGNTSNEFFNDKEWLDFSVFQSGHTKYTLAKNNDRMSLKGNAPNSYNYCIRELKEKNRKPFMNGEPAYENHPMMYVDEEGRWLPIRNPELIYFTDYDVRKDAYWSVFAGASGFTYGANDIWQFTDENKEQPIAASKSQTNWKIALQLPGALQMKYLKNLIESLPEFSRKPMQNVILNTDIDIEKQIVAMGDDASYVLVYTPVMQELKIDTSSIKSDFLDVKWFDPKNGLYSESIKIKNEDRLNIKSPVGLDNVLVIKKSINI